MARQWSERKVVGLEGHWRQCSERKEVGLEGHWMTSPATFQLQHQLVDTRQHTISGWLTVTLNSCYNFDQRSSPSFLVSLRTAAITSPSIAGNIAASSSIARTSRGHTQELVAIDRCIALEGKLIVI